MIIKVEMIIDWTDKAEKELYDPILPNSRPQTLLNEIQSNLEFDGHFKVIFAEAYETNHEPTNDN